MCGIVGVVGDIGYQEKRAFKDLLRIDVIRGPHSTGIAASKVNGDVEIVKKALLPDDLFNWKPCDDLLKTVNNVSLIGHNRYATKGAVNSINAHPFEFPSLAGVHNGTLKAQWRLPDDKLFEVDSENIYHSIDKQGATETIKLLDGAYTLVWWDKEKKELNMVRNKERPMYYCFTEDTKTMFYASEHWMLYAALTRNKIKHGKIMELPLDTLMTFAPPMKITPLATDKIHVRSRKVEVYKPAPTVTYIGKKPESGSATASAGGSFAGKSGTHGSVGSSKKKPTLDPDMLRADVDVYPIEIKTDPSGAEYIECVLLSDTSVTMRVYLLGAPHLRKYVETGGHIFHGTVNGGITVTDEKGNREAEYFVHQKSVLVTIDDRMKKASQGKS